MQCLQKLTATTITSTSWPRGAADGLRRILHQRVQKAGLPPETEWHDFRCILITNLIQESGLEVANKFIGHATLQQTAQYGRDVEWQVREAVAKLLMPAALR